MNDVALVAVRWALYVDLGLLFGLPLFALYAPGGGRTVQRHLPMVAMVAGLACLALLLSALGFALQAAAMTGLPLTQPDLSMVAELFNGTSMGTALKARLVALLVLLLSIPFYRRQSRPAFIASTLAGAVALATLAWSGHGAAGEGEAGWLQLGADLIHLLAAGAWVGALAAFLALVLTRLATDDLAAEDMDRVMLAEEALRGFSLVGTIIVALLILTGTVNGWFLVGPGNIASLGQSTYGLLLIAKLLLFAGMLGLAALNRYRLTPALAQAIEEEDAPRAQALLRASLVVEGGLAIVILGLVAWLGTLSPPMSM